MGIPLMQQAAVTRYIVGRKLRGQKRYPLALMLEPLFQCNLACAGCGKIDQPKSVLQKRMSVADALHAVVECDAPVVSIAGGEPLIHKELPQIVQGIIARKKFVYLCTNAILLTKHIDEYVPSPYFTWSIHLDGLEKRHDESVCMEGTFEKAVAAIQLALSRGYRVTINCTLFNREPPEEVAKFFDYAMSLGIEGITVSPGYSYQHAPRQDVFLSRNQSKQLFRDVFRLGKEHKSRWVFNQSPMFLDFIAGNQSYQCTPWANPTYNVFGWQKPCYLLVDEGYAPTYRSLMEDTEWDKYGVGIHPKCANCMAHCGFEGTAVNDAFAHPLRALHVAMAGPRLDGAMAPELPVHYGDDAVAPAFRRTPPAAVGPPASHADAHCAH